MITRPARTRPAPTPPQTRRPSLWADSGSEEIHLITFEWPTRSGKQTVVYIDRRRLD